MAKVSVIVPVYNVEKYLPKCLDTLVNQTLKDIEIIVVNDGATDNSEAVIDSFVYKYPQIISLKKPNGGLSDARNIGIAQAMGEYIIFLDSDDYWNDTLFLKKIDDIVGADEPDLVVFGYKKVLEERDISFHVPRSKSKNIENLVLAGEFNICAWDKVVKRELIISNNISFRINVYSEDMEWCSLIYKYANTVAVLSETPYSYRQRSGSITKKISEKNIVDVMENFDECLKIKAEMSNEKSEVFDFYLSKNISMFMIALSQLEIQIQMKYYPFVKQNIDFLKKKSRKREMLIYIVVKLLGIKTTERLLSCAYGGKR